MGASRSHRALAAVVSLGVGCMAAPALAGAAPPVAMGTGEAEAALEVAEDALAPTPGSTPTVDPTLALADLADALPALSGPARRRARALLARPTDRGADRFGDGYAPGVEVRSAPSPEGNVCIVWATSGPDAPDGAGGAGVPGYVEQIAAIAEHSRAVQVGELGWRPPIADGRAECGQPGQADVYLVELGSRGIFGYMATDPGQGGKRRKAGYLVVDNDYRPAQYPGFATPLAAARVTLAHEHNHLLQIAYSARQDAWLFEATATWAEEHTYPGLDDWLRYVPAFARNPGVPLTAPWGAGGLKPYGAATWNHWLERRYGPEVIRRAWAASAQTSPRDFAVRAYGRSISAAGGPTFAAEFVRFAAASAEWRAGPLPNARRYADVRRQGRFGRGETRTFRLHHTGYRLLHVYTRRGRALHLSARAPRGLRFGLALVARRGGSVRGRVVRRVRFVRRGGRASVRLRHPGRFDRVTAVVVNADARATGRRLGDWAYSKDSQRLRVNLGG